MTTTARSVALLLLLAALPLQAQRQWGLSDSTHYAVGGDTTLIASRHLLYRALPGDTTLLWDFTDPQEPDHFIRDVDHWSASELYVLVGSRYIGNPTSLYRSTDAGATWQVDTSFFDAATELASLNQMAIVGDTAYLFNGYYISEVLRSFDRGATWQNWFSSLIAHYYGIIPCGADAFLFGMVGDAFPPSMWQVPGTLWAQQAGFFISGCHNANVPGCHYAPTLYYAEVVAHFDSLANALCMAGLPVGTVEASPPIRLAPVPADDRLTVHGLPPDATLRISDALGRPCAMDRQGNELDIATLPRGCYLLHVERATGASVHRFVKE
jgi:hypothetical protein